MLDIADKVASIVSAVMGIIGLVLTIRGLRARHRPTSVTPPLSGNVSVELSAPQPSSTASAENPPTPDPVTPTLYVPPRSEWVPRSSDLPPGRAPMGEYGRQDARPPSDEEAPPWAGDHDVFDGDEARQGPEAFEDEPRTLHWGLGVLGAAAALAIIALVL